MEDILDDLIDVDSDHNDSDEEDVGDASNGVFSAPQQVFIVKELSKAMAGFRPSVTCEGYLAELSCTSMGLQLLHGSQFLYSLRGLPKTVRCQRAFNALEWGHVHVVFMSASDLDTFLGTLKYVDVVEQPPTAATTGTPNTTNTPVTNNNSSNNGGGRSAEAATTAGGGEAAAGGEGRSGSQRMEGGSGGPMQWAEAAARLLAEASSAAAPAAAAAARMEPSRPAGLHHAWPYGTHLLVATAGAALLAALLAAYVVVSRRGRGGDGAAARAAAPAVVEAVRRPAGGT